jgi:hypothetical protein
MRDKDQVLLENIYQRYILSESVKKSFLDDFYILLEKGMNKLGLFSKSKEIDLLVNNFEDSVKYRQYKSKIQNDLSNLINSNFLNNLKDIPFDLQKIEVYIQIDPKLNQNFNLGASYNNQQSLVRIIITLNDIVKDIDEFKNEIKCVLFHEMVHVRQIYEDKEMIPPTVTLGGGKTIEYWKKKFKEYFMHPAELEAYALEYNYRNNNDPKNIENFVMTLLERLGFDKNEKLLTDLYQDYIKRFSESVKTYKYIEI